VVSSLNKYEKTGVDQLTTIVCTFPNIPAHGIATTKLLVSHDPDGTNSAGAAIRIQGTEGEIQVMGPAYRPTHYRIIGKAEDRRKAKKSIVQEVDVPIPGGHGMFWEADEAARCLRDGKLESETLDWEEIVVIMEAMDTVRRQNGLVYPEEVESTVFRG
jgi:hypothetical protein